MPGIDNTARFAAICIDAVDMVQQQLLAPAKAVLLIVSDDPRRGMLLNADVEDFDNIRKLLDHVATDENNIAPEIEDEMKRQGLI